RIEIIRLIEKRLVVLQALCNKPGCSLPGGLQNDQALCDKPDYLNSPTTLILISDDGELRFVNYSRLYFEM
ncbi:hypothetical protein AVEN_19339-1, partial [Araneus ventricosus]